MWLYQAEKIGQFILTRNESPFAISKHIDIIDRLSSYFYTPLKRLSVLKSLVSNLSQSRDYDSFFRFTEEELSFSHKFLQRLPRRPRKFQPMDFYSTKTPSYKVDLKEAVIRSLPPDNGLYMPEQIPALSDEFWANWREYSFAELGFQIVNPLLGNDIPEADLRAIVEEAINFDAPLVKLTDTLSILELFQGPTLAFKDFGARFMARLMGYLTRGDDTMLTVLVATSGDTGGAVASAFHKVPGTRVVILYPKGKVSALQEKQLTTLGDNIHALEIDGTFDDCQRMVKAAFLNRELSEKLNLTSANSINISRLIPQSFYYFHAARQLPEGMLPTFVIPSGNFGNLTAGLLAQEMGLPIKHFVAATNVNDVVPNYLKTGDYQPRPSTATISNAMDVGAPSNFARMNEIYSGNWEHMRERIEGYAYDDATTRDAIKRTAESHDYQVCPHTAIGVLAAEEWATSHPEDHNVVLATAHPAKFLPTMEEELGAGATHIPERLACLSELPKEATLMQPDEQALQDWITNTL